MVSSMQRAAIVLALAVAAVFPLRVEAGASVEVFGNFHTAGVIVTIDASDDPDGDLSAALSYRTGTADFAQAYPLTRTRDTQLVGSLFGLQPGTRYDVRVTFTDPDGGPLDDLIVTTFGDTRAEPTVPTPSASHWVSSDGSGTLCTEEEPCAFSEGISRAQPGEEVVLKGGDYRQGGIVFPRSGTTEQPIRIRNAPSQRPTFNGADPEEFFWWSEAGGVYRTTVNVADTHLVVVDGQRLYPYQSLSDLESLSWGIPGFHADGTTLRVHLDNDANPNASSVEVSRFNHAFVLEYVDHIHIEGLEFLNYGQGSYAKAIYLNGASNNVVRGCHFRHNDLGIGLKRNAHRNVIEDNEFFDTIDDWTWEAVKAEGALETGGIRIYDSDPSPRGTVVRNNHFENYFDGFGICPDTDTGTTIETDVYGNSVWDAGDDGIEADGYCSNLRIWDNHIFNVLVGISLAPAYRGPVYALRNRVHYLGAGFSEAGYTGTCFKFNSGYGQSGTIHIFHTTCVAARPGNDALAIKSPGSWQAIVARNNIWYGTRYSIDNANHQQPLDLDWDTLWNSVEGELVRWDGLADTHLNDLAELQSATGQELNGYQIEPQFEDPILGDFDLVPSSPLIDAGLAIPGINDGFLGSAPDLGAVESNPSLFSDGFENGSTSRWSATVGNPM